MSITLEVGTRQLDVSLTLTPRLAWIYGHVYDSITTKVIPSVRAEILEIGNYAYSDGGGLYVIKDVPCFEAQDCTYTIRFTHLDYETKEATVSVGKWQTGELDVGLTALIPPAPPPPAPPTGYLYGLSFSYNTVIDSQKWMLRSDFLPFVPPNGSMSNIGIWIANTSNVRLPIAVSCLITYPNGSQVQGKGASVTIGAGGSAHYAVAYIGLNQRGTYIIEMEMTTNGQLLDSKRWEMESVDI